MNRLQTITRSVLLATLLVALVGPTLLTAQTNPSYNKDAARYVHDWRRVITSIQMYDGFTPPKATRNFVMANVAAYQAAIPGFPACRSLAGQLNELKEIPSPAANQIYDWRVTAIAAYHWVTKDLLYADTPADTLYNKQVAEIRASGVSDDVIDRSKAYGESVAMAVKKWYATDGFVKIQASNVYVIPQGPGAWEPTPPAFKEPSDPFWSKFMRPLTLASPNAIPAEPPFAYSTDKNSDFYKATMEVYNIGLNLTDEQREIALYWNDNPVTVVPRGHTEYMIAWMTPPAHWMSITQAASLMKGQGMMESLETYALVSVAMYDSFLACWYEKYRSNVIRPYTYIHRFIDSTWEPLIQTPPFPEHVSGHSSVSGAASTMLDQIFGKVAFTDSTSTPLGFEPRHYSSFTEAGQEAAMSRLYGGIHYRRANDEGFVMGAKIAEHVFRRVHTRI